MPTKKIIRFQCKKQSLNVQKLQQNLIQTQKQIPDDISSIQTKDPFVVRQQETKTKTNCFISTFDINLIQTTELEHRQGTCLCFKCSCGRHKCNFNKTKIYQTKPQIEMKSQYQQSFLNKNKISFIIPIRERWDHHQIQPNTIDQISQRQNDYKNPNRSDIYDLKSMINNQDNINNKDSMNLFTTSYNQTFYTKYPTKVDPTPLIDQTNVIKREIMNTSSYRENFKGEKGQKSLLARQTQRGPQKQIGKIESLYQQQFRGIRGQRSRQYDLGLLKSSYQDNLGWVGQSLNNKIYRQINNQCEAFL